MSDERPDLDRVVRAPHLLVACDFDGTLAPIVEDPAAAAALPAAIEALTTLAERDDVTVVIISGRQRVELVQRFQEGFYLIGEHGADTGQKETTESESLAIVREMVERAHRDTPGSRVEHKPRSVVFHYRQVEDPQGVLARLQDEVGAVDGIHLMEGKSVLEMSTSSIDKGQALDALRRSVRADAVLFLGDDTTDESVFVRLGADDLGVKVGQGETAARARVSGPDEVAALLADVVRRRSR